MSAKYYTLDEANELIEEIKPLMADLLERRARVVGTRGEIAGILQDTTSNVGNRKASLMVQDFLAIEALVKEIRAFGCSIKDLNVGLLDFLTKIDGREVYLCWRYGEDTIEYYHDLHNGFMSRKKL
jgi:hypothetical protein